MRQSQTFDASGEAVGEGEGEGAHNPAAAAVLRPKKLPKARGTRGEPASAGYDAGSSSMEAQHDSSLNGTYSLEQQQQQQQQQRHGGHSATRTRLQPLSPTSPSPPQLSKDYDDTHGNASMLEESICIEDLDGLNAAAPLSADAAELELPRKPALGDILSKSPTPTPPAGQPGSGGRRSLSPHHPPTPAQHQPHVSPQSPGADATASPSPSPQPRPPAQRASPQPRINRAHGASPQPRAAAPGQPAPDGGGGDGDDGVFAADAGRHTTQLSPTPPSDAHPPGHGVRRKMAKPPPLSAITVRSNLAPLVQCRSSARLGALSAITVRGPARTRVRVCSTPVRPCG